MADTLILDNEPDPAADSCEAPDPAAYATRLLAIALSGARSWRPLRLHGVDRRNPVGIDDG